MQDRRIDHSTRKRVAEMSSEEMRLALLTSEKTGLPNRRAFDEFKTAPFVAMTSSCIPFPTVVRISPQAMQSHLLNHVEPAFPVETQPVEGTLVLRLRIDKDGNVYKAEKVSGPDALVAPVIEAVKTWKYAPYLHNGAPVGVETTVELKFPN